MFNTYIKGLNYIHISTTWDVYRMDIIKRDKSASTADLVSAIGKFVELLKGQNEDEAVADLLSISKELSAASPGSSEHGQCVKKVLRAFEDHELDVYMQARLDSTEWTEADQLLEMSSRVMNLAKRLSK